MLTDFVTSIMTLERISQFVEGSYRVSVYFLCGIFPSFRVLKLIIQLVKRHVVRTGLSSVFGLAFNPLSTKLYLSNLKTQFVPRGKHFLPRL